MIVTVKKNITTVLFIFVSALSLTNLTGCALNKATSLSLDKNYQNFRSTYGSCNCTGVNLKASLYSSSKNEGHRTTIQIWGERNSPLRLDVRAGIGAFVAHIKQDDSGLTAYYPKQETTYLHRNPVRGAQLLGLPLPFDLVQLSGVMIGCFPGLIPSIYDSAEQERISGNMRYTFKSGPVSSITTTSEGRPVSITGRDNTGWELIFSSYSEAANGKELPNTLTLVTKTGDKAVLRIKSRELKVTPWPEEALELRFPADTDIIRLDTGTYVRVPTQEND